MPLRHALLPLTALMLTCASPREDPCQTRAGESSVAIDCAERGDGWSDRASEEAREGFEERSPGGRP